MHLDWALRTDQGPNGRNSIVQSPNPTKALLPYQQIQRALDGAQIDPGGLRGSHIIFEKENHLYTVKE